MSAAAPSAAPRPAFAALSAACAFLLPVLCILWALDTPLRLGVAYLTEQYLALILGLVLGALYFDIAARAPSRASIIGSGVPSCSS